MRSRCSRVIASGTWDTGGRPAVQDRLACVQRLDGLVLIEEPGVDPVVPLHGSFAGGLPVGGIVPLVLQRGDPLAEEVVGVVAVEGDARTEDVDHRETRVLDGALDEPDQLLDVA